MRRDSLTVRRAEPSDAGDLSDLAQRSKAHWGYPDDFIARHREDLTVSAADIEADEVWMLEAPDGRLLGFYRLVCGEPAILDSGAGSDLAADESIGRRARRAERAAATAVGS